MLSGISGISVEGKKKKSSIYTTVKFSSSSKGTTVTENGNHNLYSNVAQISKVFFYIYLIFAFLIEDNVLLTEAH